MTKPYVDSAAPVILWFRNDLRLHDHAGVAKALSLGTPIVPVFILDDALATRPLGAASKWWLHRSLDVFSEEISAHASRLIIMKGDARDCLEKLVGEIQAKTIICSHEFDPGSEELDDRLEAHFKSRHVDFQRVNTRLLSPPGLVTTKSGGPFRVFTPFFNAMVDNGLFEAHDLPGLSEQSWPAPANWPKSHTLEDLKLNDTRTASGVDWAEGFSRFTPGERGARKALRKFLREHLESYATDRDRPDKDATSHLSPHLRFGEISPQRILFEVQKTVADEPKLAAGAAKFRAELAWREFSYGLLKQQPRLDRENFRDDFDGFPWRNDDKAFRAWCRGETGYPLVDAGMRELWQTGYMHNRVRMVCASFLVKHLLIDWRRGEKWFWDCLLDADPANNPASWQWVAGCGADAAPYFRVFNPTTQADKFDPNGHYRARYIPGYTVSSTDRIHSKKTADLFESDDKKTDVKSYPQPIVDHAFARERALEAYKDRQT